MSLKSVDPLPPQKREHPEKILLPKGMVSKGGWERKRFSARRFKKGET